MNLAPMSLVLLVVGFATSEAITNRVHGNSGVVAKSALATGFAELARYEAEDKRFWSSEWAALEGQLQNLTAVVAEEAQEPAAVVKDINLNPKSAADLAPALAMLKGLYEDGKDRIGKLNAREKEGKDKFDVKEKEHAARMAKIEAKHNNHTLSNEFYQNETHDEGRLWQYWSRVRERQHKQYHTGLKIQHATLDKVKKMIDMYEKTMSGTANAKEVKKMLRKVAPPEIVFLQEETRVFCKEALEEVHEAKSGNFVEQSA